MWILQYLLCLFAWITAIEGQCTIPMPRGLPQNEPLILQYPATALHGDGFRYPGGDGKLNFAAGEQVRLVCSGPNNYFVKYSANKQNDITAVCKKKDEFTVATVNVNFRDLKCNSLPLSTQRIAPVAAPACSGTYVNFEIGHEIGNEFIKLIEVCHDPTSVSTLYTKFQMSRYIHTSVPRYSPPFVECPLHSTSYNAQYDRDEMIATFGKLLGSSTLAATYVKKTSPYYLARGHFVANLDFIYKTQQAATCYFINQAPQWHSCNSGNWVSLEKIVRRYATSTNQDLTVYTGGHEIGQLLDIGPTKKRVDLYLKYDNANTRSIPVPRFYWKVIYNESTKRGIAFVEINNQYLNQIVPADYQICTPVQNTVWNNWGASGHICKSYICDVDDLRRSVRFPQFPVVGRLG